MDCSYNYGIALLIALFILKLLKGNFVAIIRGSPPLGSSFIVAAGSMLVSSFGQTIMSSWRSAELQFLMVKRVLNGTKRNVQMMTMRPQRIQPLTQTTSLSFQTANFRWIDSFLAAAYQFLFFERTKAGYCAQKLIDAGLSAVGCLKLPENILYVVYGGEGATRRNARLENRG